jgi:hypothetical protein
MNMTTELSRKLYNIMAREMGSMGKFIIEKQCKNIGLESDAITKEDLMRLSKALGNVMVHFGGREKAEKLISEIKKLE